MTSQHIVKNSNYLFINFFAEAHSHTIDTSNCLILTLFNGILLRLLIVTFIGKFFYVISQSIQFEHNLITSQLKTLLFYLMTIYRSLLWPLEILCIFNIIVIDKTTNRKKMIHVISISGAQQQFYGWKLFQSVRAKIIILILRLEELNFSRDQNAIYEAS